MGGKGLPHTLGRIFPVAWGRGAVGGSNPAARNCCAFTVCLHCSAMETGGQNATALGPHKHYKLVQKTKQSPNHFSGLSFLTPFALASNANRAGKPETPTPVCTVVSAKKKFRTSFHCGVFSTYLHCITTQASPDREQLAS